MVSRFLQVRGAALTFLIAGLTLILRSPSALAVECPSATLDTIKKAYEGRGEMEVIFFASWCASCKPHLQRPHAANTMFVAVFDERDRAEKVLRAFAVEAPCFTSDGVAEELNIRSLPAARRLRF